MTTTTKIYEIRHLIAKLMLKDNYFYNTRHNEKSYVKDLCEFNEKSFALFYVHWNSGYYLSFKDGKNSPVAIKYCSCYNFTEFLNDYYEKSL